MRGSRMGQVGATDLVDPGGGAVVAHARADVCESVLAAQVVEAGVVGGGAGGYFVGAEDRLADEIAMVGEVVDLFGRQGGVCGHTGHSSDTKLAPGERKDNRVGPECPVSLP